MARSKRSVEKEEFWRLVRDEHAASGLSVRAFCQRESVSEASFYFWRRQLAIRDEQSDPTPSFPAIIPVRVLESEQANLQTDHAGDAELPRTSTTVEVGVPGGFTLRADVKTDADQVAIWLGAILRVAAS